MVPITLAVVPSSIPGDRLAALEAVCARLAKLLDTPVVASVPASYEELAVGMERDRIDYAWMSPALVVLTEERIQLRPLLSAVREDRTEYASALFVDAGSRRHTLAELRGATVAWVDLTSASGYILPRLDLAARGIDPTHHFGKELVLGSHAEVVRAVFDGRADVGATYGQPPVEGGEILRAGFRDVAPDRDVRVLAWSPTIPNDVIVGHGLAPNPEHRELSNAVLTLCELPDGRALLQAAFHAERFMTTPRNALRPLRDLVREARALGLLPRM